MDVSEVRRRLKLALDGARRAAAERRARSDAAAGHFDVFLESRAIPMVRQLALALTAEGHPFQAMTPAGTVRLSPERSPGEFIELYLDPWRDPPEVMAHIVRGRGGRTIDAELPVREGTAVADLTDEHLVEFLTREVVAFVHRK